MDERLPELRFQDPQHIDMHALTHRPTTHRHVHARYIHTHKLTTHRRAHARCTYTPTHNTDTPVQYTNKHTHAHHIDVRTHAHMHTLRKSNRLHGTHTYSFRPTSYVTHIQTHTDTYLWVQFKAPCFSESKTYQLRLQWCHTSPWACLWI